MPYFQYDVLRAVARFVTTHQWTRSNPTLIRDETGLSFSVPATHTPWRNYLRIFKLSLLISEKDGVAIPTLVAQRLTQAGVVTCDEYMHFLVKATTDPSPALNGWKAVARGQPVRHPLCFALKFFLVKVACLREPITSINEVIGAYIDSGFSGSEDDTAFVDIMHKRSSYAQIGKGMDTRQAKESIKLISQISYLHNDGDDIITCLSQEDAMNIFKDIYPIAGPCEADGDLEIRRLADLFKDGSDHAPFDCKTQIISDELESGFSEGSRVKKFHIVIERNSKLRELFFDRKPTTVCDACSTDTKKRYPWVERILDLHHILPLASGTRVDSTGTVLGDLVPVCPTCHRAIHRFYDGHLKSVMRQDFLNKEEARDVYAKAKEEIIKEDYYA